MTNDSLNHSVAPGDIRAFSAVLDDLNNLLVELRSEAKSYEELDFGEYVRSASASNDYRRTVRQRTAELSDLIEVSEQFTVGTSKLAHSYEDMTDLNNALAKDVTRVLEGK